MSSTPVTDTSSDRPILRVVVASTRPGRIGRPVADWVVDRARSAGGFRVEVTDLAELDLPMMNEPNHPRLAQYTLEHTKAWSALVDGSDAFILVMPEYNYGFTAPLKNALDYLSKEWAHKPVGFVSYGGASGGMRAVELLKPVLTALRLYAVADAVALHFVANQLDERRVFQPTSQQDDALARQLTEIARVAPALRTSRLISQTDG